MRLITLLLIYHTFMFLVAGLLLFYAGGVLFVYDYGNGKYNKNYLKVFICLHVAYLITKNTKT